MLLLKKIDLYADMPAVPWVFRCGTARTRDRLRILLHGENAFLRISWKLVEGVSSAVVIWIRTEVPNPRNSNS